jgi:hypothetical protein
VFPKPYRTEASLLHCFAGHLSPPPAELAFEIHILLSTSAMKELLFGKKVAAIWVILSSIAGFVFGPGFLWEWRRSGIESARLDLDTIRASLELREK